jgi:hypothetical protein
MQLLRRRLGRSRFQFVLVHSIFIASLGDSKSWLITGLKLFVDSSVFLDEDEFGNAMDRLKNKPYDGRVYCPICTHTVNGSVALLNKKPVVVPGQKCPRCASVLDAGIVLQILQAA